MPMNARFVLCALGLAGAARAEVAVLPTAGPAPPGERAGMTKALRAELTALGLTVQAGEVTDRTLADAATFGADCTVTDATCALQLGGVAGVDRVVVAALDGGRLILRLHDVGATRELARVTVPSSSASPQKAARLGAVRLIAPERETGTLALQGQTGAVVVVDGVERGTTPLPPLALPVGSHAITVTMPGRPSRTIDVEVIFDELTSINLGSDTPSRQTGQADTVYVLDAVVDGYSPLTAALLTAMTQDVLGRRDGLVVVPPDTIVRVLDQNTLTTLQACRDDDCASATLAARFQQGDVLFVDVERIGTGSKLSVRRRSLTPDRRDDDDVIERISPVDADGRAAGAALGEAMARLYSHPARIDSIMPLDRFGPPPLSVAWLAAPAAVGAVGTTAAIVGAVMLTAAPTEASQTTLLAATISGSVAAGSGAIGAAMMVPFIDWNDLQDENAKLLQARTDRQTTRR
jgi:hypothetical protein